MMFSGLEPTLKDAGGGPAKVLFDLSFGRWALEALSVNEYSNYPKIYMTDKVVTGMCESKSWTLEIDSDTGIVTTKIEQCITELIWLGAMMRVVCFLFLKLGNRQKG